jgi:TatD DNase family protein
MWIDTHAHLDVWSAPENQGMAEEAWAAGVGQVLIPAVAPANFAVVRTLAQQLGYGYALGIHPLYVAAAGESALAQLEATLQTHAADPHLVAVGEAGLDFFLPELRTEPLRQQQTACYRAQIRLAQTHGLPLVLHVRPSVDAVLKELRSARFSHGGIAHAFNGSMQQAGQFLDLGFKLGFGGACTHARATHLQDLVRRLPAHAIVMETDSPDMPPVWAYTPKQLREQGQPQAPNTPLQLPRIGAFVAQLRQVDVAAWQAQTTANACAALPRLAALLEKNTH